MESDRPAFIAFFSSEISQKLLISQSLSFLTYKEIKKNYLLHKVVVKVK